MILVCVGGDEDEGPVRAAAEALARDLGLRVGVVQVSDAAPGPDGPCVRWTLRAEAPAGPLLDLATVSGTRHILLSPKAWERWGGEIREKGGPRVALAWGVPNGGAMLPGLSLEPRSGAWRRALKVLKSWMGGH